MRLALRYRSRDALWRHIKEAGTLYLEIVDYPGEWLLDLPMLEQEYLTWSRQMLGLLHGERATWAAPWLSRCAELDPLAPADERALAAIAQSYTDYLLQAKAAGLHFIQPGRFVLPGDMAGAPALQFSPGRGWTAAIRDGWRGRINAATSGYCANATATIASRS
ncbi:hypothetical protein SODG_004249 [Sodalis praecaptivus]